jgi:hypothetical protein
MIGSKKLAIVWNERKNNGCRTLLERRPLWFSRPLTRKISRRVKPEHILRKYYRKEQ